MQKTISFEGIFTALVTPFYQESLDIKDLEKLVQFQIEGGVDGVVAAGTTGESPTLLDSEYREVLHCVRECARGRSLVIAGVGSNNTRKAIENTKTAHAVGVDALLAVTPYYNKPTPRGLFEYYSAIAQNTDKPILLYSVPSRCSIEIDIPTIVALCEKHPHIAGIKEATDSIHRVESIYQATQSLGPRFTILSGNDSATLAFIAHGARGLVSVASNVLPQKVSQLVRCALQNDFIGARALYHELHPLFEGLFKETNPIPTKFALQHLGIIRSSELRAPLTTLAEVHQAALIQTLDAVNRR